MQVNNTGQDAVVLEFSLTRDDLLDAFAAQYRAANRPWYLRWSFLGPLIGVGVVAMALLVVPALAGELPIVMIALPLLLIVASVTLANPRLLYWQAVRQLVKGNPGFVAPATVALSPAGIHTSSAMGTMTANWSQFPYHLETETSFLLLATDRLGAAVHVLPKRGLRDGDPGGLRGLLATTSRRLG